MTSVPEERSPIIVEDPAMRDGFTQIPNAILRDPDLSIGAKITYGLLLSYAWGADSCYPGQERMASDMGGGERSVRRYMSELTEAGMIEVQQRGLGRTNLYILKKLRPAILADQDRPESAPLDRPDLPTKNTQRKDSKKKMQISNFELPPPIEIVRTVAPEFKTAHPDLWQAGCSGVAEFIRVVGRGLWSDEEMNVAQWQKNAKGGSTSRTEG